VQPESRLALCFGEHLHVADEDSQPRSALIDPPSGAAILSIDQPGFPASYPQVMNIEHIPTEILAGMELSWRQSHFGARPLNLYRLRDVFVVHEGLVFDAAGRVYRSTITQHSPEKIASGLALIRDHTAEGSIVSDPGPALLCAKRGGVNYGHFMLEMLPKAHLGSKYLRAHAIEPEGLRFIVCQPDTMLWQVMINAFALLEIDPGRLIPISGAPVHFRELIVLDGLSEHGSYMSPLVFECLDQLAGPIPAGPARKLFVSRPERSPRRFSNEREIMDMLRAEGFQAITPGALPLTQQIAAFKGARTIFGAMGAGMTNIAFAESGAAVTVFAPMGMPDTFFWFIATHRHHAYREVRCQQVGPLRGPAPWDAEIYLPPATLRSVLAADRTT
jgi:capsular polysaccharide biosynthesis protein